MDSVSSGILVVLGLVAFNNFKNGTLGDWFKAKFFNQTSGGAAPATSGGGGAGHALATLPQLFTPGVSGFIRPVGGPVTSPFGPRARDFHEGMDFGVPVGTPVHTARAGTVIAAGSAGGYGLKVDVDHGGGIVTRYAHLSRIDVRVGDTVAAGGTVGASGNTGESTGPHLHFEIRTNGKAVDPAPYLAGAASAGALAGQTAVSA